MENASKALLIAGGVLLGIMVLSLFLIMINSLTDYQQSQIVNERQAEAISFNNNYTGYMRDEVPGTDIMSLVNKVVFYNRTKSSKGTGTTDTGEDFGYEPIELEIVFPDNSNKLLAIDLKYNKLYSSNSYKFDATSGINSTNSSGFSALDKLLNNTRMPDSPTSATGEQLEEDYRKNPLKIYYTEGILKALLENDNSSESIFDADFKDLELAEKRKRFKAFNLSIGNVSAGKVYFPLYNVDDQPISEATLDNWWDDYFGTRNKTDTNNKTIKEELAYYYEYTQFQRGVFKYCEPTGGKQTYSSNTGRIIYMKFEFTGKFL